MAATKTSISATTTTGFTTSATLAKETTNFFVISSFHNLYTPLNSLLENIKSAAGIGGQVKAKTSPPVPPTPASPKGTFASASKTNLFAKPPPPTSGAATAYGDSYTGNPDKKIVGAKTLIEKHVKTLTDVEVNLFSGLGFTDPNNMDKKRTDIVNSALSAWDASAAKFMHADRSGGDTARVAMKKRLDEFDAVVDGGGKVKVTPDQ